MDNYIDWCCDLLPKNCNESLVKDSVIALQELSLRFGINRFAMVSEYDCTRESIPVFLLRTQSAYNALLKQLDPSFRADLLTTAILSPGLYETEHLDRLLFSSLSLLPIRFPISTYQEWMDLELNHLLYKKKYRLLFTSFELAIVLFPEDTIKKLMRISGAVFQFNYKALTDPRVCRIIEKLLEQKSKVLLGTSLTTLEKVYFYEFEHYLATANQQLSPTAFRLLITNNYLPQRL